MKDKHTVGRKWPEMVVKWANVIVIRFYSEYKWENSVYSTALQMFAGKSECGDFKDFSNLWSDFDDFYSIGKLLTK